MGTSIQSYNLEEIDYKGSRFKDFNKDLKGNNDLLSLTQPDIIQEIHEKFLDVGANIISTNTFNSNRISMNDYDMGDLVLELNRESVLIAKKAVKKYQTKDKPIFIAGSIGPTNKTASISPNINQPEYREVYFDDLVEVYTEQIKGLISGGVDILLIETIFDTLNAKACLFAINTIFEEKDIYLPVMVSATLSDNSGRILSGQTLEAFLISVSHFPLFSIGLNCSLGATQLLPYIKELSNKTKFKISIYPNAGLPNELGYYDQTPEKMKESLMPFFDLNILNIIGGCCGSTPEHIKKIAEAVQEINEK